MNVADPKIIPSPEARRVRRWRRAGVTLLALGAVSAGVVYAVGVRRANLADDPAMAGYYKAESRQMGVLYGKEGILIEDLKNDLARPGPQAVVVFASFALAAAGCLLGARILEGEARAANSSGKDQTG